MQKEMSLPRRVRIDEIPRSERWSLGAVYEIEKERIRQWLEDNVELNFSERDATLPSVLSAGDSLTASLEGIFARKGRHFSHEIIQSAEVGSLEREAGSWGLIQTFGFLRWIAFVSEVFVFLLLMIFSDSNIIVILQGILLALSGFITGYGASEILSELPNKSSKLKGGILFSFGVTGIIGICVVRAIADPESAFVVIVITTVLVTLLAIFEALFELGNKRYKDHQQKEYQAQQWWATEQHCEDVHRDVWRKVYSTRAGIVAGNFGKFFDKDLQSG